MRKQYIRWILPVVALLIVTTILVLGPALFSHAASTTTTTTTTTTTKTPTPTATPTSTMKPNWSYYN
jgi:hypothetical protein